MQQPFTLLQTLEVTAQPLQSFNWGAGDIRGVCWLNSCIWIVVQQTSSCITSYLALAHRECLTANAAQYTYSTVFDVTLPHGIPKGYRIRFVSAKPLGCSILWDERSHDGQPQPNAQGNTVWRVRENCLRSRTAWNNVKGLLWNWTFGACSVHVIWRPMSRSFVVAYLCVECQCALPFDAGWFGADAHQTGGQHCL